MLPLPEKILEIVVYEQLVKFLEENSILNENQSGFRKNHCTESTIQTVLHDWKENLDMDKVTVAVFIDLSRAFETIDRSRLLLKLKYYGITGVVFKWIEHYLSNRKQILKWDEVRSDELPNNLGVPQGSVLGPLLFIIFINDLPDCLNHCKLKLFADDALIYFSDCDIKNVIDSLNNELNIVNNWLCVNGLILNISKTKCMAVCKQTIYNEVINNCKVKIGCEEIEWVKQYKYLGVIIDVRLNFNEHAEYLKKKIGKKLGFMSRLQFLPMSTKKMLYNALILPHFNYCNTILFYLNQAHLDKLQVLQNKGMRLILRCSKYTSSNELLKRLEWLDVRNYLFMHVMLYIWKALNGALPKCVEDVKTVQEIHQHNTRQVGNFYISNIKRINSFKLVFKSGLSDYNKLPKELKDCKTSENFKKLFINYVK